MLKRKYYLFERNNYFYGKLLTSKDFQNEQEYLNNKRRLVNRTLHGTGIVYGMNVLKADDASIVIQSGMALDGSGREVVVPQTQVVKLASIDGYQEIDSQSVYLGIAYNEEAVDPIYSVMGNDGEEDPSKRYNGTRENYRLFLMDEADCLGQEKSEQAYIHQTVIYQDTDIRIVQKTPAYAIMGRNVIVKTEIEKLTHSPMVISAKYQLTAEGFANSHVEIRMDNQKPEFGEKIVIHSELKPENYIFGGNELALVMSDIEVQKEDKTEKLKKQCQTTILPVKENMLDCVLKNSYKGILDADLENKYDEKLWLAKINILKAGSSVIIDSIQTVPMEQYVYNTDQLMIYNKISEYLPSEADGSNGSIPVTNQINTGINHQPSASTRVHSSGVFEMSLGSGGEAGRTYFSDEIMHGLGNGAAYVEVGVEYLNKDIISGQEYEEIILGDNTIFAGNEAKTDEKVYQVDTAVKILPGRGTFVVGVRPKVKMGKISLRIRWYALKPEDMAQKVVSKEQNGCIMIQPDTIVVQPKGTTHINPVFINMKEEALTYTLLDSEGGKIENNGTYTAPAQEGVYEVRVSCISNPDIFAQAFIVVSQKKNE